MKKLATTVSWIFTIMLLSACSIGKQTLTDRSPKLAIQFGTNKGGITENSDLNLLENANLRSASTTDAYKGATRTGFNIGLHVNQPFRKNQFEVGMDYMYNNQSFRYSDAENKFIGFRNLDAKQFMLPLSYNITLFKNTFPRSEIQLKLGYLWQLNFIDVLGTGVLPNYFISSVSRGGTCGISAYLLKFQNGGKLGIYWDVYRGSHIFTDYYYQSCFPMAGSSFVKTGIRYQF